MGRYIQNSVQRESEEREMGEMEIKVRRLV